MINSVAFIGFGAIGQDVFKTLQPLFNAYQTKLLVLRRPDPLQVDLPEGVMECASLDELLAFKPQLVIEAAAQAAVSAYIPTCLTLGISVVITSIGALTDADLVDELVHVAELHGSQILLPSGAIGGLDYLQSVRHAPDLQVVYESRKPVAAWLPELAELNIEAATVTEDLVLFEGNAAEAAQRYPKNLNVAATLALAGVGMQKTKVNVVVDPTLTQNQHVIQITSQFGSMRMVLSNTPSPANPKSSWVVAQSIASVVQREFSVMKVR